MDDLKVLQPTIFPVVPRLLNRMFDRVNILIFLHNLKFLLCSTLGYISLITFFFPCCIQIFGQANTTLKRWLLEFASKRKEAELRSGIIRKDSLWDKLIFQKVQV